MLSGPSQYGLQHTVDLRCASCDVDALGGGGGGGLDCIFDGATCSVDTCAILPDCGLVRVQCCMYRNVAMPHIQYCDRAASIDTRSWYRYLLI
jgi:hypothetical protein